MTLSQNEKIHKVLVKNSTGFGITTANLARKTKLTTKQVTRRIADLRNVYGFRISSNRVDTKTGQKFYYKLAM